MTPVGMFFLPQEDIQAEDELRCWGHFLSVESCARAGRLGFVLPETQGPPPVCSASWVGGYRGRVPPSSREASEFPGTTRLGCHPARKMEVPC